MPTAWLRSKQARRRVCCDCGRDEIVRADNWHPRCAECGLRAMQRTHRDKAAAPLKDRRWLETAYETQSCAVIARGLGCSPGTVRRWLLRHGIARRDHSAAQSTHHATRAHRIGRSRQMVTGRGLSDSLPGTVKHFGS